MPIEPPSVARSNQSDANAMQPETISYEAFKALTPSDQLAQSLTDKVQACITQAERFFARDFSHYQIELNLRGKSAGQVRYSRPSTRSKRFSQTEAAVRIRFNPALLALYGETFIQDVVPHEVAHYVAYAHYGLGIKPHGPEWQYVMTELFNSVPLTTHDYHVPSKPAKSYSYICACDDREHALSAIRHRRVMEGSAKYMCRVCRHPLRSVMPA